MESTTTTITVEMDTVGEVDAPPPFAPPTILDDLRRDRQLYTAHMRDARNMSESTETRLRHLCDAVDTLAAVLLPEGGENDAA